MTITILLFQLSDIADCRGTGESRESRRVMAGKKQDNQIRGFAFPTPLFAPFIFFFFCKGFQNLKKLKILSIQSNRITKLEGLEGLEGLDQLYLSHNGIQRIEGLEKNVELAFSVLLRDNTDLF